MSSTKQECVGSGNNVDKMETDDEIIEKPIVNSHSTHNGTSRKGKRSWSDQIVRLIKHTNNYPRPEGKKKRGQCVPFLIGDVQVGLISAEVLKRVELYPDVFMVVRELLSKSVKFVSMSPNLKDEQQRTTQFSNVMRDWRDRELFPCLKGWRNELYSVKETFSGDILLKVERSCCSLFGFRQYGVHINGYVRNDSGDVFMWIARRSKSKPTFPGKLDNTVAGGIAAEDGVMQTVIKECKEEAAIPEKLSLQARPAGTLSYFYEDDRGLFPETQFVFDLELPRSFEPQNTDKEVSDFYLLPIKEVKELIATDEFKPNCALVLLDFFIRHGAIDPDTEPRYIEFAQGCRQSLPY